MVSLALERPFGEIRVSELLERADVGRATLYAHFRDKEDLLIGTFLDMIDHFERQGAVAEPGAVLPGARPLLRHFHEAKTFARAMARAGKLDVLLRALETRLRRQLLDRLPARPDADIIACAASGAFVTVTRAWLDAGAHLAPDDVADSLEAMLAPGWAAAQSR